MNENEEFILARGNAGVYAGYLVEEKGEEVILKDAFCLWYWSGGGSLLQVALEGVKKPQDCKFSVSVPLMRLKKVFQIIPCSEVARKNLQAVTKWKF